MPTAESLWKQLTLEGNRFFERGDHDRALIAYERARAVALERFDQWPCADDAVAAVVVSYLNLSEAYARSGDLTQASAALCTVHGSLLQALSNDELPQALRDAATRHLRETFAALAHFEATHGPHPETGHWLRRCGCGACEADAPHLSDADGLDERASPATTRHVPPTLH